MNNIVAKLCFTLVNNFQRCVFYESTQGCASDISQDISFFSFALASAHIHSLISFNAIISCGIFRVTGVKLWRPTVREHPAGLNSSAQPENPELNCWPPDPCSWFLYWFP